MRTMLLRRLILAGLAPLLSLPAFAAAMGGVPVAAHNEAGVQLRSELFTELWRTVVSLVQADHDAIISIGSRVKIARESIAQHPASGHSSSHAFLALDALTGSALGHSLWMVQQGSALSAIHRRPVFSPLRC